MQTPNRKLTNTPIILLSRATVFGVVRLIADRRTVLPPTPHRKQRAVVHVGPEVGHGVEALGDGGTAPSQWNPTVLYAIPKMRAKKLVA